MTKSIHLSAVELSAVLVVAANTDVWETFKACYRTDHERQEAVKAYISGIDKLRAMLSHRLDKAA